MERVVLSRVTNGMKVYLSKEVQERLRIKEGDLLAWELLDGEARAFKARISKETG